VRPLDPSLLAACAASAIAWATLAAWRARQGTFVPAARALLGGGAAFGLAYAAYELAPLAGLDPRWEQLLAGDARALALAVSIGLVEEGAKLAGILLAVERRARLSSVLAASMGVAAGFSALEALLVLPGLSTSPAEYARVALGPVAHAALAVPLAFGVAAGEERGRWAWLGLVPALVAAAALHGAGDLSLTFPLLGKVGYAAAMAGPAVWLFARARRPALATAPAERG
jgi:RsiW-degrading membrane proteinase PrsW (M82 family)